MFECLIIKFDARILERCVLNFNKHLIKGTIWTTTNTFLKFEIKGIIINTLNKVLK